MKPWTIYSYHQLHKFWYNEWIPVLKPNLPALGMQPRAPLNGLKNFTNNMSTDTQSAPSSRPRKFIKRPDDSAIKSEVNKLRDEIKKLDVQLNELTAQIGKLQIDEATKTRQGDLRKEIRTLISKQGNVKQERNQINDEIKKIDAQIKKRIAEIQGQTSKNQFKNVAEIDQRVNYLDGLVDAGNLKLADERRYVKEMSSLRKLRKDFGGIEKIQALIDADKEKIAELKQKLSQVQNKELNAQFDKVNAELAEIDQANKGTLTKRNGFYDKRNAIKKEKDAKYDQIRKLRADFDDEMKKFKAAMADEIKRREEEDKQRAVDEKQSKLKAKAERELAEALVPAFTTEINAIHNLLLYFDPSYVKPLKKDPLGINGSFVTNTNIRTVEMPADVVIIKKDQEEFIASSKLKKGKSKAKKNKNFTVDPDVITELSTLSIPFPTKEDEVAETVKVLTETLEALEAKQDEQTKVNIEKAKARVAQFAEDDDDDEEEEATEEATEEAN